jgi:hypothetical protein
MLKDGPIQVGPGRKNATEITVWEFPTVQSMPSTLLKELYRISDKGRFGIGGMTEQERKHCSVCSGLLDPSTEGGYVHLNDSDDTHTPVVG